LYWILFPGAFGYRVYFRVYENLDRVADIFLPVDNNTDVYNDYGNTLGIV
jgi:hypothetical protein